MNDVSNLERRSKTAPEIAFLVSSFRLAIFKTTQLYLRNPLKIFKPVKYDTLYFLRVIDNHQSKITSKRFANNNILNNIIQNNSLCVIYRSIKASGFKTIYDKILPPFVANTVSGTVLFTTYLTLDRLNYFSSFTNGFLAGIVNNAINTPLENFYNNKILNNQKRVIAIHQNGGSLLKYIYENLDRNSLKNHSISAKFLFPYVYLKEGLSYGAYFYVFEIFKADKERMWDVLRSGVYAAISLQLVNHPMRNLDRFSRHHRITSLADFIKTLKSAKLVNRESYTKLLYKGFVKDCLFTLPTMTGTLILLDYLRSITN
ncbi:uncharacterized protein HGUI_03196 [Hanseniaspora guilliermondii]|uniref:Mitochondrial carrier protein n=1 Tax=Hanseniaspora guilliermondii TaxID=56406 RepID=A0A1L0B590_9ASCO|nr:uncharacterized protein HGUI_03196 [Hanseniaspora guilliermondii]